MSMGYIADFESLQKLISRAREVLQEQKATEFGKNRELKVQAP